MERVSNLGVNWMFTEKNWNTPKRKEGASAAETFLGDVVR